MKKFNIVYSTMMAAVVLASGLLTTSCNKDSEIAPLELNQTKAATQVTVKGEWGNPSKPNEWPKVYINLYNPWNVSEESSAQVVFENRVNGNISPNKKHVLKYINKDINAVTREDWNTQKSEVETVGYHFNDNARGWYTYDLESHGNKALENVTILVGHEDTGVLFAVRLVSFSKVEQKGTIPGPNGDLRVRGDVNIAFRTL
ncbi:hypothetical protein [Sphingobacterium sp.]|uniref:hypothetical protein n=1 Tax=Sphingobacterium sp. TaxID=341027 RepID=UPI0028975C13|nr:hypothetical protein [Sphingobacterium sp.]